ncbi:MAG: membrane protein insertion efficiency factor YidD [Bdellovibrionales bacterium]|nr:membrane protein insertion efficiency factor YidD [Bdellovibrionales bacterium]
MQFYRVYLSSWLGGNCRFYPSCSEYAVEALNTQSPGRACRLIFHRLCKCHPFGESGYDPVPCNERTK